MSERPATSECNKLRDVAEESQNIGEFLEWLESKGMFVGEWDRSGWGPRGVPVSRSINELLADYFNISLDAVEAEQRAILEWIRKESDQ